MAEATNGRAFIAAGIHGEPMPRRHGAPLRLAVPWQHGFKSVKSITRVTFTDTRPMRFREALAANEHGLRANVSPAVAHLHDGLEGERLFR